MALDREKLLSKHYDLSQKSSAVPSSIMLNTRSIAESITGTGIATPASHSNARFDEEERQVKLLDTATSEVLTSVFEDERINLRQRESIAKAILGGEYRMGSPTRRDGSKSSSLAAVRDLDLTRGEGLLRRHGMQRPRFIEVVSSQLPIQIVDAHEVLLQEQQKRRSKAKKTGYFLFNQYIPESEKPIYPDREVGLSKSTTTGSRKSKAGMIMKARLDLVKKCKEEVSLCKEEAARVKRRAKDSTERQRDTRVKIAEFRQKVLERLTERGDPLKGRIMRSLSDKVALALMEQFRGWTMSVDAIISLLGTSLGAERNNGDDDIKHVLDVSESLGSQIVTRTRESAAQSMEQAMERMPYGNEYPMMGRTLGSRAASRPRPVSPPPAIVTEDEEGGGRGTFQLPPPKSPSWNAPSPSVRRLGSGFNVQLKSASSGRPSSSSSNGGTLAVGAMQLMAIASNDRGMSDSIMSATEFDLRSADDESRRVINALIDEMRGDGTLPSLQPERVITDKQLERLGTHEATFDSIAREVKFQRSKKLKQLLVQELDRSQSLASMADKEDELEPGMDIELGFEPRPNSSFIPSLTSEPQKESVERITNAGDINFPRALKTRRSMEPDAPYKTHHERQLVLGQGISAGAGLALWSGPRVKVWEGSRVKTVAGFRARGGKSNRQFLS